ncbi:MAG: bifunctional 2-C-methyl-D-erythritol 4-phosphate cytidylyltransferase/2-C-methyl-D-erythritol 2,4-cyclodiphosphate synthase [Rhodospirillaceae bacterium]|nr:bifunctional 2-C-methyl-D-erythritol 4-phosphate cytidylyltransferase/2-C-methyl-D-erythritol 2,4-cyclodiphosphate synthase [Rhodospirillaceae bacterium]
MRATLSEHALRSTMSCAAVIVAAGRGRRAGGDIPKQYASIGGEPVLRRTVRTFASHPRVDTISVVIHSDDQRDAEEATNGFGCHLVRGGPTRQESSFNGLKAMEKAAPDIVLIHDAARPFLSHAIIDAAIDGANRHGAAVAGIPIVDTIKATDAAFQVLETVPRERLWRAQTPQAFRYSLILGAHQAARTKALTDDAAVAEAAGLPVVMTEGSEENFKITTADDLQRANQLAIRDISSTVTLIGSGFDVHAFEDGDHVTLCGERIAHSHALKGHSDADVALHALTDAILGALAAGDIGQHFPDSDPQWRGVASDVFLQRALDLVAERKGRLINLDLTLICERPRLQVHRDAMIRNLAALTGLTTRRIGLKATTTEKLGFTGRGEGIAVQAVVSLSVPDEY